MIQSFQAKGMSVNDAHQVVNIMSKYENFFISYKLLETIGGNFNDNFDNTDFNFLKDSLLMFLYFLFYGNLPYFFLLLNDYIFNYILIKLKYFNNNNNNINYSINFYINLFTMIYSLLLLLYLNKLKNQLNYITNSNNYLSYFIHFILMLLCFILSYFIGYIFYIYIFY